MAFMRDPLELDYVYYADGGEEFRNTHVTVTISDEDAYVIVTPEQTMSHSELEGILSNLVTDMLKKMRLCILDDCHVILKQNGQSFKVSLSHESCPDEGIKPERLQVTDMVRTEV